MNRKIVHRSLFRIALILFIWVGPDLGNSHAAEKAEANVVLFDALTTPGKAVRLEARVWENRLLGRVGLGGESLIFLVGKKTVGTVMTGGDGRAFLEFTPRMRGNFVVTARLTGSPRVSDAEGTSILASWERRKPILLIDIAAVMKQNNTPKSPVPLLSKALGTTHLRDPEVEAVFELEKLGKFYYNLLYVFRSESGDVEQTQEWLHENHFPPGFLKIIKSSPQMLKQLITELKDEGWENVSAGIGRTEEFAEVLVEQRLKTVIIREQADKDDFPRRTILIKSWQKVRKHL